MMNGRYESALKRSAASACITDYKMLMGGQMSILEGVRVKKTLPKF